MNINYESAFFKNSVALIGMVALGFLAFMIAARPFQNTSAVEKRQLTASELAALRRIKPPASVPAPDIDAEAYIVQLVGEREPLLSRRELKPLPPASLTKLMTAVVAMEELAASDLIVFSSQAKAVDPTQSNAKPGEIFLRDDALKFALISSANDAAEAIAEAVGKKHHVYDRSAMHGLFADLMNQKARQLNFFNTHFKNPIGLDDPDHTMSAADVGRLLAYIFEKHQRILEISRTVETTVYSTDRQSHTITNTDDLLKEFPAIMGSKTGFTDAAQGALALVYPVKPNHVALIVLMGSHDRFSDGRKLIRWLEDSFSAEGGSSSGGQ
jgi:D-alanyl-D-alanine carboxypeptidase